MAIVGPTLHFVSPKGSCLLFVITIDVSKNLTSFERSFINWQNFPLTFDFTRNARPACLAKNWTVVTVFTKHSHAVACLSAFCSDSAASIEGADFVCGVTFKANLWHADFPCAENGVGVWTNLETHRLGTSLTSE